MINGRVDRPLMRFRMTPEMGQKGIFTIVPGPVVVLHKGTLRRLSVARGTDAASPRQSYIASSATQKCHIAAGTVSGTRAVPFALQSWRQKHRIRLTATDAGDRRAFGRGGGKRIGETGNSGARDRRVGGVLQFDDAASAFRSDGIRGNPQEGLLGPALARRESRSLVLGLPSTAALVTLRAHATAGRPFRLKIS